ncbi:ribosomal protein S16 [Lentinus tigrinus ALCF2SS1-7]|uniref:ribosomal protein S16 n=1 Tax=Lentinus tigrinus ALCF2SS1-7 TaxID=1328758 RepID=UPI0011661295|nr:ribosomal protein S16 [Lentinus tigrinus ALCF2SS1-7]
MAVRLRMAVHGVRNSRIFHIVAVNQRQRRNAKPIELLGVYDPRLKPGESTKTIQWSVQRIQYWLNVGATPSKTVTKLLHMGGILPSQRTESETLSFPASPSSEATPQPSA